tara:strand:+ start:387 stop:500 length:114 start_codon:yes stop_codon:yes gene_type:complete
MGLGEGSVELENSGEGLEAGEKEFKNRMMSSINEKVI